MAIWKPSLRLKILKCVHSYSTIYQGIHNYIMRNCIVWDTLTYYNAFPLLFVYLFIDTFLKLRNSYAGERGKVHMNGKL